MKCPVCILSELKTNVLEGALQTLHCGGCGGHFLQATTYWKWLEEHGENLPEIPAQDVEPLETNDVKRGKLCAECGGILVPYHVGRSTGFSVDRCGQCGGIWFDKNEWETLRLRNLHDDIHFIFSKHWQDAVAREERDKQREARLRQTFGDTDYEELLRIKAWLDAHPRSRELYSFLMNERAQ